MFDVRKLGGLALFAAAALGGCCLAQCFLIDGQRVCVADELVSVPPDSVAVPPDAPGTTAKAPASVAEPTYGSVGGSPSVVTYHQRTYQLGYGCTGGGSVVALVRPRLAFVPAYRPAFLTGYGSTGTVAHTPVFHGETVFLPARPVLRGLSAPVRRLR